jgi:protein TonB
VTYGPDCGAYGLPCAEELAFAIDVEPEAVDVHALVFFRERRVLFEHAGRIVGSRRLDADAEPLLRMVRAPRDTVRMPAFHDPDAGVGQDSRLCVFVDRAPVAVRTAPPAYPDSVRDAGVVGTVVTRILIDTEGRVRGANMIQSVPRLDEAVRDAVRQWRFEPALCGGQPVTVWVDLPFTFRLH